MIGGVDGGSGGTFAVMRHLPPLFLYFFVSLDSSVLRPPDFLPPHPRRLSSSDWSRGVAQEPLSREKMNKYIEQEEEAKKLSKDRAPPPLPQPPGRTKPSQAVGGEGSKRLALGVKLPQQERGAHLLPRPPCFFGDCDVGWGRRRDEKRGREVKKSGL